MITMRNVTPGAKSNDDPAMIQALYRKALWTIIGHGVFFVACVAVAVIARRMFKMPLISLEIPFI